MSIILERGEVTLSNILTLSVAQPGKAVVLSGRNGTEVVTPDTPKGQLKALAGRYRHYAVIDTGSKSYTRTEKVLSYDGMSFTATVKVTARVSDPKRFMDTHGENADHLTPFYDLSMRDMRQSLHRFGQRDIEDANRELERIRRDLAHKRPVYDGVELLEFSVVLAPDTAQSNREFSTILWTTYKQGGSPALHALKASFPSRTKEIDDFIAGMQSGRKEDLIFENFEFDSEVDRADKAHSSGIIAKDEKRDLVSLERQKQKAQQQNERISDPETLRLGRKSKED